MSRALEVAIAAGGTAGHINPALALAEELKARGHHVTFYGQPARLEGRLVPEAGFELVSVDVTGFDRARPWTLLSALVRMGKAEASLKKRFASLGKPDVAVGFGAYIEMPLMKYCKKASIPYLLHEQNSVPGLANKTLAKDAKEVCISVPAAKDAFDKAGVAPSKIVLTGNPVRKSVIEGSRERGRASLEIPQDATLLLVFGGSLGARTLNESMAQFKEKLLSIDNLYVAQSTGREGYEAAAQALSLTAEEAKRWKLVSYIDNMGDILAAADLVLSRAGASSIAEIAALAVPSILVPYPFATADHQTTNARYLVDAGAALLFKDEEAKSDGFGAKLIELLTNSDERESMRNCAKGLSQVSAAVALADELEKAVLVQ